jgi:origin recognition complex subunit 3
MENIRATVQDHRKWVKRFLQSLQVIAMLESPPGDYAQLFINSMSQGVDLVDASPILDTLRRMPADGIVTFLERLVTAAQNGDSTIGLGKWSSPAASGFAELLDQARALDDQAQSSGLSLRSKYSGQTKVVRTTVIAQKVQLSHDSAALTEEDKAFTVVVDRLVELVQTKTKLDNPQQMFLNEIWLYDSKTASRDIFVPRPRATLERSLTRPHDYLGCSCCSSQTGSVSPQTPAAAIIYHLYLETGSLINVADLWSAFSAIASRGTDASDERRTLVQFYRGLAELRALGFVKPSKKKTDHIAKLKWL